MEPNKAKSLIDKLKQHLAKIRIFPDSAKAYNTGSLLYEVYSQKIADKIDFAALSRQMNKKYRCQLTEADIKKTLYKSRIENSLSGMFRLKKAQWEVVAFIDFLGEPSQKNFDGFKQMTDARLFFICLFAQYGKALQLDALLKKLIFVPNHAYADLKRLLFEDIYFIYGFSNDKNISALILSNEQERRRAADYASQLAKEQLANKRLQDEFEERLKEGKSNEVAEFFAKLNSEQYGCILDSLIAFLRQKKKLKAMDLPAEVNAFFSMADNLIKFVKESRINPIEKIGAIKTVRATDVEHYSYEGAPFIDNQEEKEVMVISPGWRYEEKQIIISRPRVKQITENEREKC